MQTVKRNIPVWKICGETLWQTGLTGSDCSAGRLTGSNGNLSISNGSICSACHPYLSYQLQVEGHNLAQKIWHRKTEEDLIGRVTGRVNVRPWQSGFISGYVRVNVRYAYILICNFSKKISKNFVKLWHSGNESWGWWRKVGSGRDRKNRETAKRDATERYTPCEMLERREDTQTDRETVRPETSFWGVTSGR